MRERNPCLRLRRRLFGWYVRFMTKEGPGTRYAVVGATGYGSKVPFAKPLPPFAAGGAVSRKKDTPREKSVKAHLPDIGRFRGSSPTLRVSTIAREH